MQQLTKEQAIVLTGFTGLSCITPFSLFHENVEKRLGRPVFTHELGTEAMVARLREIYKSDFLTLCYREEAE